MQYRHDVDGLRAVAIVPVVLYHFGVPGFPAGYVGVDVFFVISGFLITSLIQSEIRAQEFSLLHFYERRIRRIFPALFFLLLITTALAFTLLFPRELIAYGKSLVAAAGFLANVKFWREAGYFDNAADLKPLLHTWSLAVEEQFYLLFPPLMILIARFLKARYTAVFLAIFITSLALSIWGAYFAPSFTFYFLPTRMWELLLGALIAVSTPAQKRNKNLDTVISLLGAGMIAAAVVLFTSETPFPGAAALLPCLGAAFIIATGASATPVRQILSWTPVVFIGKISYSLYLWHWPLYVFAKYRLDRDLTALETTLLIILSVIVATLSWRYIEGPFRGRRGILTAPTLRLTAGAAMAVTLVVGLVLYATHGVPQRFDPQVVAILAGGDQTVGVCRSKFEQTSAGPMCKIGSQTAERPSFIIWGDSHAGALMPAVARAAEHFGVSGLSAIGDGCPPLVGADRTDPIWGCRRINDNLAAYLASANIDTVILISRWSYFIEGTRYGAEQGAPVFLKDDVSMDKSGEENRQVFERAFARTIQMLRGRGLRVIVVGPVPEIGLLVPETLARKFSFGQSPDFGPTLSAFEARNRVVLADFGAYTDDVEFVYPHRLLCATGRCAVSDQGKALYVDDDHLSLFGAAYISGLFEPLFASMAAHAN